MSELKPWTEEGGSEAVALLLKAARREQPSPESLTRALAAVGAGMVTASTTAATAATLGKASLSAALVTKASLSTSSVILWMMVGAALGGVTFTVAQLGNRPEPTAPVNAAAARNAAAAALTRPARAKGPSEALPQVVEAPASNSVTAPKPRPPTEQSKPAPAPAEPKTTADSEHLAEEVRAIDDANGALTSGRPEQTLLALDRYEHLHRAPRFAPEALYLRMEALVHLGRLSEASRVAQRLVTEYPKSPQAAKARFVLTQTIP